MAKKAAKKKVTSLEETLWDTANKLRGSVESSEYKHIVLSLIFLSLSVILLNSTSWLYRRRFRNYHV